MEGRIEGCAETGEGTGREGGTGSRGIRTGIRSVKGGNRGGITSEGGRAIDDILGGGSQQAIDVMYSISAVKYWGA